MAGFGISGCVGSALTSPSFEGFTVGNGRRAGSQTVDPIHCLAPERIQFDSTVSIVHAASRRLALSVDIRQADHHSWS
jgi:hypothetical protein